MIYVYMITTIISWTMFYGMHDTGASGTATGVMLGLAVVLTCATLCEGISIELDKFRNNS